MNILNVKPVAALYGIPYRPMESDTHAILEARPVSVKLFVMFMFCLFLNFYHKEYFDMKQKIYINVMTNFNSNECLI